MIEQDLQRPVASMFKNISDSPVAAASLGQVYKAQLASDGSDVAVKVCIIDSLLGFYPRKFNPRIQTLF